MAQPSLLLIGWFFFKDPGPRRWPRFQGTHLSGPPRELHALHHVTCEHSCHWAELWSRRFLLELNGVHWTNAIVQAHWCPKLSSSHPWLRKGLQKFPNGQVETGDTGWGGRPEPAPSSATMPLCICCRSSSKADDGTAFLATLPNDPWNFQKYRFRYQPRATDTDPLIWDLESDLWHAVNK